MASGYVTAAFGAYKSFSGTKSGGFAQRGMQPI